MSEEKKTCGGCHATVIPHYKNVVYHAEIDSKQGVCPLCNSLIGGRIWDDDPDPKYKFGTYKGKTIREAYDIDYTSARWTLSKDFVGQRLKNKILAMLGQPIVGGEDLLQSDKKLADHIEKSRKDHFGKDYVAPRTAEQTEEDKKQDKIDEEESLLDQEEDEENEVLSSLDLDHYESIIDEKNALPIEEEKVDLRKKEWQHGWTEATWRKKLTALRDGDRKSVKNLITRIFTK